MSANAGRSGVFKHDAAAQNVWQGAFDAIPKSVFAMACWHLSDCCADEGVGNGGAENRFAQEIEALRDNGLISPAQAKRALAALARAKGQS